MNPRPHLIDPHPIDLPYRTSAGIMLVNDAGLVWTGRRRPKWIDERSAPIWQMPQGGIDPGEAPRAAALRELKEETGITNAEVVAECRSWLVYDLPPELLGVALKGRYRGQRQMWFLMRFWGDDAEIDIRPRRGEKAEFDRWAWRPKEELTSLVVPFKRRVYETVISEFSPLLAPEPAREAVWDTL
jgi:putative (di)nucleoside polyphosphate hydrolase